jgi:hypothetical protein
VLVLIARRQWRGLMWTGVGAIVVTIAAIWVVTSTTFHAFFSYMLPRLSHGDRFFDGVDATNRLRLAAVNFSVFGFVMKLREFGIAVSPGVADALTWAFTALLAILVWVAARQVSGRLRLLQVCLAALVLAATRSPFVPSAYGALGALWLIALVAGVVALAYVVPDRHPGFPAPRVRLAIGLVQQLAVFGLAIYPLLHASEHPIERTRQ